MSDLGTKIKGYVDIAWVMIVIGGSILFLILAGCGVALWPMLGLFTKVNRSYVWIVQFIWFIGLIGFVFIANMISTARYKKEKEEFERKKSEGLIPADAKFRSSRRDKRRV